MKQILSWKEGHTLKEIIKEKWIWYLISINILAFIINSIDYHLYKRNGKGVKPAVIVNIFTICGGAIGTLLAEFFWDRKINKVNAQSRMYSLFWIIIQVVIFYGLYGPNHLKVKQFLVSFYNDHRILCFYFAIVNVIAFIMFAIDKLKALLHKWRIREVILLCITFIGGSVGALLAMDLCNHKVNSNQFMVGVPLMLIAHMILLMSISIGVF